MDGQVKWVTAGSGYLSQHTKALHFGLGGRDRVEKIVIDWPSGKQQQFGPFPAGHSYEIVEASSDVKSIAFRPRSTWPSAAVAADNVARLHETWLWEPVPLPDRRQGPALLVVHAGEDLPRFSVPIQAIDIRSAEPDLVAGYAIFRRYMFDYRAELSTPFWMLIDEAGRLRKVYPSAPEGSKAAADVASLKGRAPRCEGIAV